MDNDLVIRTKASNTWLRRIFGPVYGKKASNIWPRQIFVPVYENDSEWTLRQNEELCQLLVGPVSLKYIKLKKLQ